MTLPFPPLNFRRLVGPLEDHFYDNPNGDMIWGPLGYGPLPVGEAYRRVFDFGCGCGRNARQLLLMKRPPERYVGIDVSRPMIKWCKKHLGGPHAEFYHHDVRTPDPAFSPGNSDNETLPIAHYGGDFTLINAHSVFTHLLEHQVRFYLGEMKRMLSPLGLLRSTWFFFNRAWFPPLAPTQHCLYLNFVDPTQAVYYDWSFFVELVKGLKLRIVDVTWTYKAGFQNVIYLALDEAFGDLTDELNPPASVLGFGGTGPQDRPESPFSEYHARTGTLQGI